MSWPELIDLVDRWRGPKVVSNASSTGASTSSDPAKANEHVPPDPGRTRRACQILAGVVNSLPNDMLRQTLAVISEELFNAIFRDYRFVYDPRDAPRTPRLCEDSLMNAVPYSAVVQSLRDAAKDAIMRRLELEARCCVSNSASAAGVDSQAGAADSSTAPDNSASANTVGSVGGSTIGASAVVRPANTPPQGPRTSAMEEVQLREELRHARLLADSYQSRTLELERMRIELEEQVRRSAQDREKEDARRQKLTEEVRRLRKEADSVRAMKAAYEAERSALQSAQPDSGRRGDGTRQYSRRPSHSNDSELDAADLLAKMATGGARSGIIGSGQVDDSFSTEGELPSSRLRIPIDMAVRRGSGSPSSPSGPCPSVKSLRSPRDRTCSGSTTSVAASEGKPAAADVAGGGGSSRVRRGTAGINSSGQSASRSLRAFTRDDSKGWR